MKYLGLIIIIVLAWLTTWLSGSEQTQPLQFYSHRPTCTNARALDLSGSWETPTKSGITVWVCD